MVAPKRSGLLWGDCDEPHARANLRCALHWLRKALPLEVAQLQELSADVPFVGRERELEILQALLGPERSYHPLRLSRLSREETALLLDRLLRWRDGAVFDLLYAETEGNPLFLVKLVRSLVQSGALQPDKEGR